MMGRGMAGPIPGGLHGKGAIVLLGHTVVRDAQPSEEIEEGVK